MGEFDLRSKTDQRAKVIDTDHVEIKEAAKPAKSLKEWLNIPGFYKVLTPRNYRSFIDQIAQLITHLMIYGTRDLPRFPHNLY